MGQSDIAIEEVWVFSLFYLLDDRRGENAYELRVQTRKHCTRLLGIILLFFLQKFMQTLNAFNGLMVLFWSEVCCVSELERFIVKYSMGSWANVVEQGFIKATPQNLSVLTVMSIVDYMQSSEEHLSAELRNRKLER